VKTREVAETVAPLTIKFLNIFDARLPLNFLYFVDLASRYNRVKKNQLDAQLILSTFRQFLHVSDIFKPIIMR